MTKPTPRLLDEFTLEQRPVVANCSMNRLRTLRGSNGYDTELHIDALTELRRRLTRKTVVRWLDLCCGAGKALIEAAHQVEAMALTNRIEMVGLDLAGHFDPIDEGLANLQLVESSIRAWAPAAQFDLITCVHGLHYVGDKLGAIQRAISWLTEDGLFVASLDVDNVRNEAGAPLGRPLRRAFQRAQTDYVSGKHLVRRIGGAELRLPFRFLGADEDAGPNYTGQPAVNSHYRIVTTPPLGVRPA